MSAKLKKARTCERCIAYYYDTPHHTCRMKFNNYSGKPEEPCWKPTTVREFVRIMNTEKSNEQ